MKTNHCTHSYLAAFGLAACSIIGFATDGYPAGAAVAPTNAVIAITVSDAAPESPTAPALSVTASPGNDSVQWSDIQDQPYDLRSLFLASLKNLEAKVDDQIGELTGKRATLSSTPERQNCDFAIKQMGFARTYLRYMSDEIRKATPATWDQAKSKVGQAWVRTQKFYDMGKSSIAS